MNYRMEMSDVYFFSNLFDILAFQFLKLDKNDTTLYSDIIQFYSLKEKKSLRV